MSIQPGPDRLLAQAIRRQLKTDAETCDLSVHVSVYRGIVHLYTHVDNLTDPDNLETLMQRVPGVRGVIEELDLS